MNTHSVNVTPTTAQPGSAGESMDGQRGNFLRAQTRPALRDTITPRWEYPTARLHPAPQRVDARTMYGSETFSTVHGTWGVPQAHPSTRTASYSACHPLGSETVPGAREEWS